MSAKGPDEYLISRIITSAFLVNGAQPFRYRFSSAGEPCLRALVYDAFDHDDGLQPAIGNGKLKWNLSAVCGTAVGERIEAGAKAIGLLTQQAHEFDTGAVRVKGSSDIVAPDAIIDIKLVGEKKWSKIEKKPDPKHVLQVNGYAVSADKTRWILFYVRACSIFDDAPELEYRLHAGDSNIEMAQELCGVWEQVDSHRKLRTLPERMFEAAPNKFPCGWCRHQSRCLTNSPEEGAP